MAQWGIDLSYEWGACARTMPECFKAREQCLGQCGGESVNVRQDFATHVSKRELSIDSLGHTDFARARADCNLRTGELRVPLFEGGSSFAVFSSYLRVRSGMSTPPPHSHAPAPSRTIAS